MIVYGSAIIDALLSHTLAYHTSIHLCSLYTVIALNLFKMRDYGHQAAVFAVVDINKRLNKQKPFNYYYY